MIVPEDKINQSDFEKYRNYLKFLARVHLSSQYSIKMDISDVVQQSLLTAFENKHQFRGSTNEEKLAWFRSILIRIVQHAARKLNAQKRDIKREQSIEQSFDASSMSLLKTLKASESSPCQRAMTEEQSLQLMNAMEQLPDDQRQALILKYWQGKSMQEMAQSMNKSISAIGGLLHRANKNLRKSINSPDKS